MHHRLQADYALRQAGRRTAVRREPGLRVGALEFSCKGLCGRQGRGRAPILHSLNGGQDSAAYQARVNGACAVGSTIRAINDDGTVVCEAHDARPGFSLSTLDIAGTSVTIGADGLGLISYSDETNRDLKVAHCSNAFCVPYFRRR